MNTHRTLFPLLACTLLLTGTACFDNSNPVKRASAVSNVTGNWTGTTSKDEPVRMILSQSILDVTGSAKIGETTGNLTGTIDGTRFEATMQTQPVRRIFATVNDTNPDNVSMSGSVRDLSGGILSSFSAILL